MFCECLRGNGGVALVLVFTSQASATLGPNHVLSGLGWGGRLCFNARLTDQNGRLTERNS